MGEMDALLDSLQWDDRGLIPAIAQDAENGDVLMMAWMNRESLALTISTRRFVYYSISSQCLWRKGDTSGHIQELVELRVDCDADCLLLKIRQTGPACHTGSRSCFFRSIDDQAQALPAPE